MGTAHPSGWELGTGHTLLPLTLTRFFCSFLSTRAICILRRSSGVSTRASACALQRAFTLRTSFPGLSLCSALSTHTHDFIFYVTLHYNLLHALSVMALSC